MKCEICHKQDAKTAITIKKDGESRELYVCPDCAAAAKERKKKSTKSHSSTTVFDEHSKPPPFVEEFFKAAMGLVDGLGQMAEEDKHGKRCCPTCKTSWEKIQSSETLGCPDCWKVFAREISKHMLDCDYGRRHVGAVPPQTKGKDVRIYLERELALAIKRQQYEKAAELQRRICAIDADAEEDSKGITHT